MRAEDASTVNNWRDLDELGRYAATVEYLNVGLVRMLSIALTLTSVESRAK